jgi:hypothetical protein
MKSAINLATRPQRFAIEVPIYYREAKARKKNQWFKGRTKNISWSGVMFETANLLKPTTDVEVRLALPAVNGYEESAEVLCRGTVVRVVPAADKPDSTSWAAAVLRSYRFVRPGH